MEKFKDMPTTPEDLTAEWLNFALRSVLPVGAAVTSVHVEVLVGAGNVGQVARVKLTTNSSSSEVPKSLIAKLSHPNPMLRELFQTMYLREDYIYSELVDRINIATPICYYTEVNQESGQAVLLLEDLGHLQRRNVLDGCNVEDAEHMIDQFANLHGHWWNDPLLSEKELLKNNPIVGEETKENWMLWWSTFEEKVSDLLPDCFIPTSFMKLGDRTMGQLQELHDKTFVSPRTLTHHDAHLDNLMFGAGADDPPIMVIDWQSCAEGVGAREIAYFMISSLPVQLRRRSEQNLLKGYHAKLLEIGIKDYSFDDCWRDYCLGFFSVLFVTNILVGCLDMTRPYNKSLLIAIMPRLLSFAEDHNVAEFLD